MGTTEQAVLLSVRYMTVTRVCSMPNTEFNRRHLICGLAAGATAAGASVGFATAGDLKTSDIWQPDKADAPRPEAGNDYRFFTATEAALIAKLVDRIIPPDDLGPGAHEAGVTFFLDRQLAGPYGQAQGMYMGGPWSSGTDSQGYQTRLTPAAMYRTAIPKIEAYAKSNYRKSFAELSGDAQDSVVRALEAKQIDLGGAPRDTFFTMLLQNVNEGYFSDPLYGGNRNMAGWKMIGFPGAHYNYRPFVHQHNKRLSIDAVSIMGGPTWTPET